MWSTSNRFSDGPSPCSDANFSLLRQGRRAFRRFMGDAFNDSIQMDQTRSGLAMSLSAQMNTFYSSPQLVPFRLSWLANMVLHPHQPSTKSAHDPSSEEFGCVSPSKLVAGIDP